MIGNRPSLFGLVLRDFCFTSDVAGSVQFSTGFLSGPRTWPRMMSDASWAWSGAKRPSNITSRIAMVRRGNTKALERIQVYGSGTCSTHDGAYELEARASAQRNLNAAPASLWEYINQSEPRNFTEEHEKARRQQT